MVMADTKICLSQEMGMKFFTNSKVRQPVVCTSETVRPVPYFLNAGFTASTHHVKSSGNIGNRREVLYFCLNELWKRHGQYSQISFGNVQTFWTLHLNPGLAQNEIAYDDDQWPKKKNKHKTNTFQPFSLHFCFMSSSMLGSVCNWESARQKRCCWQWFLSEQSFLKKECNSVARTHI